MNTDDAKYCRKCGQQFEQEQETNPWYSRIAWAIIGLATGFIAGIMLGYSLGNSVNHSSYVDDYEISEDTTMVVEELVDSTVASCEEAAPAEELTY